MWRFASLFKGHNKIVRILSPWLLLSQPPFDFENVLFCGSLHKGEHICRVLFSQNQIFWLVFQLKNLFWTYTHYYTNFMSNRNWTRRLDLNQHKSALQAGEYPFPHSAIKNWHTVQESNPRFLFWRQ